jgi:hypothetical protein
MGLSMLQFNSKLVYFSVLIFILLGCGASDECTIEGKVTYKGSPLSSGDVNISQPGKGVGAVSPIDENGVFNLSTPVPAGVYEVSVTPTIKPPSGVPGVKEKPSAVLFLPKKVQNFKTSGISFTLKNGVNQVAIEIMD